MSQTKYNRQSESFWQNHMTQWQESGLSQHAYCQEHNLVLNTFGNWKRKLNPAPAQKPSPDSFVELSIPALEMENSMSNAWDIELSLGSDIILRLRRA